MKDKNNHQGFVLKFIFILFCLLSLFFWYFSAGAIVLNAVINNDPRLPLWYLFVLIFPPIYLIYFLLSCTKLLRGRRLLLSGILIHLVLALWVLLCGTVFTLIVGLIFTGLWIVLYKERIGTEGNIA